MTKTLTFADAITHGLLSLTNASKDNDHSKIVISETPPQDLFENMRKMAMLPYVASLPFDYFEAEKIWKEQKLECLGDKYISICDLFSDEAGDAYVLHQAKRYKIDHSDDISIFELITVIEAWEYDLEIAEGVGVYWEEDNYDPQALQMYTEEAEQNSRSEYGNCMDFRYLSML